jgi:hypothetical protein
VVERRIFMSVKLLLEKMVACLPETEIENGDSISISFPFEIEGLGVRARMTKTITISEEA